MNENEKQAILDQVKKWWRESVFENHVKNTEKLANPKEFKINPFSVIYLSNFLTGNSSPESIARALILPRVLGTSISTTIGEKMQSFTSEVLGAFGSTTSGIDIEFTDAIDQRKKYCQLKLGPNTLNKDDVETITRHFDSIRRLASKNNLAIMQSDLVVGVLYGNKKNLSGHYKKIENTHHFPVYAGEDFWVRLTGDVSFYSDIASAIASVAIEANFSVKLESIIHTLSQSDEFKDLSKKGL